MAAINSKYIHSSLAVRSLYTFSGEFQKNIVLKEFTINQQEDYILKNIYREKPHVVCFSCYLWNIEIIRRLISEIKKIMPETVIVLGGPEVSYEPAKEGLFGGDIVSCGEGEETFKELMAYFILKDRALESISGLIYRCEDGFKATDARKPLRLDDIPFCYKDCIDEYKNKIIYYESQRGCPFSCQYCLSSIERGIRFLSFSRIKEDLKFFLDNNIKQVKFVDRTFNCDEKHALFIWDYIIRHDNGRTNFHFEISADLITKKTLAVLKKARKGLIQLEIGVQSTNENTLSEIKRKTNLHKLFESVKEIKSYKNIHQHLDLIAGLPEEGYESFKNSFNDVFAVRPDMLQLGFLKLLRGSGLRINAEKLGIVYRAYAPYEVLYTNNLTFSELLNLKAVEEMTELYYNSGNFSNSVEYAINKYGSAFDFFKDLGDYWEKKDYDGISHNKIRLYEILFEFVSRGKGDNTFIRDLIKFDLFSLENMKNLPQWLNTTDYSKIKKQLNDFYANEENMQKYFKNLERYEPRQRSKMCHIERFNYDIISFINKGDIIKENTYILFNYHTKEKTAGNSACYKIEL